MRVRMMIAVGAVGLLALGWGERAGSGEPRTESSCARPTLPSRNILPPGWPRRSTRPHFGRPPPRRCPARRPRTLEPAPDLSGTSPPTTRRGGRGRRSSCSGSARSTSMMIRGPGGTGGDRRPDRPEPPDQRRVRPRAELERRRGDVASPRERPPRPQPPRPRSGIPFRPRGGGLRRVSPLRPLVGPRAEPDGRTFKEAAALHRAVRRGRPGPAPDAGVAHLARVGGRLPAQQRARRRGADRPGEEHRLSRRLPREGGARGRRRPLRPRLPTGPAFPARRS